VNTDVNSTQEELDCMGDILKRTTSIKPGDFVSRAVFCCVLQCEVLQSPSQCKCGDPLQKPQVCHGHIGRNGACCP